MSLYFKCLFYLFVVFLLRLGITTELYLSLIETVAIPCYFSLTCYAQYIKQRKGYCKIVTIGSNNKVVFNVYRKNKWFPYLCCLMQYRVTEI